MLNPRRKTLLVLSAVVVFGLCASPALAQESPPAGDAKGESAEAKAAKPKVRTRKAGAGVWTSIDDFMRRTGQKFEDMRVAGTRVSPFASETFSYTDNAYYQDRNETIFLDMDFDGNGTNANPRFDNPRGQVAELVNTFRAGVDFEMPLNFSLVPLVGEGRDSLDVLSIEGTSVEYLKHGDSPDSLDYKFSADVPLLLNSLVRRFKMVDGSKHAFWFRAEGDYETDTDPLDVNKLEYRGTGSSLGLVDTGERSSFERTEWFGKGTLGWKGPRFDAELSWRYDDFQVDDDGLNTADHNQQTAYGEVGYTPAGSDHRYFGLYEFSVFHFDETDPNAFSIRDWARYRAGLGWEGPVFSRKIRGSASLYWMATNVYHDAGAPKNHKQGHPQQGQPRGFDEYNGVGGSATLAYRPFVGKATTVQGEYERLVDWSVVAEYKVVDKFTASLSHPINEKWSADLKYTLEHENVAFREKRLYQEVGLAIRYRLFEYTTATFEYTFRHMRSSEEPLTAYGDAGGEAFLIQPDGDFTANVFSVGLSVEF
jgi:hypothetical protein